MNEENTIAGVGAGFSTQRQYDVKMIGESGVPTVRENIENRIARAEAQVIRLKETKAKMEKSGLLDLRISDLREAMDY